MRNLIKAEKTGEPVYIDYPFENVAFRYQDGKAYKKFYGEKEHPILRNSQLFLDGVISGTQITEEQYQKR
ncbi:MAG: hypothetical protein ACJ746_18935 [Bryobacteraceae bacterium]